MQGQIAKSRAETTALSGEFEAFKAQVDHSNEEVKTKRNRVAPLIEIKAKTQAVTADVVTPCLH